MGRKPLPLLGPHNVRPFETVWPVEKREADGLPGLPRFAQASGADAELRPAPPLQRQRGAPPPDGQLVPAYGRDPALPRPGESPELRLSCERELTADEVYGLTALFNSALWISTSGS